MKKLEINKIDNYQYELKDTNDKVYNFNIEFYNIDKLPKVGDYIYLNEKLLQEEYSLLSFDTLESTYGRTIRSEEDEDLVILLIEHEKIYLKRVYG